MIKEKAALSSSPPENQRFKKGNSPETHGDESNVRAREPDAEPPPPPEETPPAADAAPFTVFGADKRPPRERPGFIVQSYPCRSSCFLRSSSSARATSGALVVTGGGAVGGAMAFGLLNPMPPI
ncbi:MAG: hypothetical protein EOP88_18880 [Verrucomicrobiaceae bacterium]|nr:MAG: hypothetical protein EOP88_18880 [Verrucomicrobiaceae bacterium]